MSSELLNSTIKSSTLLFLIFNGSKVFNASKIKDNSLWSKIIFGVKALI